jgi:hypothetical protein
MTTINRRPRPAEKRNSTTTFRSDSRRGIGRKGDVRGG